MLEIAARRRSLIGVSTWQVFMVGRVDSSDVWSSTFLQKHDEVKRK